MPSPSAAVKVPSTGKAKPRIVSVSAAKQAPMPTYEPDLVRVKAIRRGQYAVREVMKHPGTLQNQIVRNAIIRNEGEVFDMDTADMRPFPLREIPGEGIGGALGESKGDHIEKPHASDVGTIIIETERGQFELPSWVTIEDAVDLTAEAGHKLAFGKKEGEVL